MPIGLPMIDWTISVGNLINIVILVCGLMTFFWGMKGDIRIIRHDMTNLKQRQETLGEAFTQLGTILTQVAVQDTRINRVEADIVDLRHGRGFVDGKSRQ